MEQKVSKWLDRIIVFLVWTSIIEMYLGIWIDAIRWKLIFTALFSGFLVIILVAGEETVKNEK